MHMDQVLNHPHSHVQILDLALLCLQELLSHSPRSEVNGLNNNISLVMMHHSINTRSVVATMVAMQISELMASPILTTPLCLSLVTTVCPLSFLFNFPSSFFLLKTLPMSSAAHLKDLPGQRCRSCFPVMRSSPTVL
jgi:hypothetical protein